MAEASNYKCRQTLLFRYERFINSDFSSSTRGEWHNSYMLTIPNARYISWCLKSHFISAGRDLKNLTTTATVENSTTRFHSPISTVFFKILKFSAHLFWAWHYPHSSHFSSLGFIMTMVTVISFTRERKTVPNGYAPELLMVLDTSLLNTQQYKVRIKCKVEQIKGKE